VFLLASALVMALFVLVLWGNSLWAGLMSTTVDRSAIFPATRGQLLGQVVSWIGPWIALALVGAAFRVRRDGPLVLVLLTGSVIGVVQQIRIEDSTSLNKHLAFGLVFACPLIGDLAARALRRARWVTVPAVALALLLLLASGLHFSGLWLTAWIEDDTLLPPLRAAIALNPDKAILAEEGAPERYALRREIEPAQYGDTYALVYSGLTGDAAYRKAIGDTHYGVIYLSATTERGRWLRDYLSSGRTPYRLSGQAVRILRGERVGTWLIFTPKVSARR
jgi:hypothetical protein